MNTYSHGLEQWSSVVARHRMMTVGSRKGSNITMASYISTRLVAGGIRGIEDDALHRHVVLTPNYIMAGGTGTTSVLINQAQWRGPV